MPDDAAIEERVLGGTTARRGEAVFVRGEGCWLVDSAGRRYLDLSSAQGVAMLGHCHPRVTEAIARQAGTLTLCPNYLYNDVRAAFAQALTSVLPAHLPHVFLANSGAEAVDGALKFARLATGRPAFVATTKGFHGRTFGALSVTWEPKYREGFQPLLETTHVPFNDLAALDKAIGDSTAAVILEVVQGESGVNVGKADFLIGAQRLCRERGALLIVDEIQTGFGRTGRWFACEHAGLEPDMLCMAKGLGGGFPMGAFAYTKSIRGVLYQGAHGSTFGGSPLACAAGVAALAAYREEGLIERSAQQGAEMLDALRAALSGVSMVRDIRGLGLMLAIELRSKVAPVLKSLMLDHGVIALPAGPTVLRLLPPLVITREEIDIGVRAVGDADSQGEAVMDRSAAIDLIRGLVAIPSLSHHEAGASAWLVSQMQAAGYERAFVDEAGNAVGEIGAADAAKTVVLLGHIDTVPGDIPVRIEQTTDGDVLYGRGSVDAKGPLATFVAAAARLGKGWAHESGLRVVVVGAVEEEAATSKGARFIAARFDGRREPIPSACVIGEPSHAHRITLGYKGRLLMDLVARQPMAHTAGPDASVATVVVDLWNWIAAHATAFNAGREKAFDQLSPSLRRFITSTTAGDGRHGGRADRMAPADRVRRRHVVPRSRRVGRDTHRRGGGVRV